MTRVSASLIAAVLLAVWPVAMPAARAEAPFAGNQAPGFYRMRLGRFEVTALLDGTPTFPIRR